MSIIGLDLGSHTASIALWYEDKKILEVIADDLGSRTIPCTVAFRGDEVITGQTAISQRHKNPTNTFDDLRKLLESPEISTVNVPLLEKEITVQELASHFFRNIHNQVKQQVGTAVRDCVVTVPVELDEVCKKRFVEAAQAGGIRIKSFILDSTATLLAYELDNTELWGKPTKALIVDIGWSQSDIAIVDVSAGLFFPVATASSKAVCGEVFVNLLTEHCAKEFTRKSKIPVTESKKSMMRLRSECEHAMKSLSTGAEATIDIDSLCEGVDYSTKISRARFEDLISIPFIHMKKLINDTLVSLGLPSVLPAPTGSAEKADSNSTTGGGVQLVLMSGGPSSMPKIVSTIKNMFPDAKFPRSKFESSETQCIGAALHGKYLLDQVSVTFLIWQIEYMICTILQYAYGSMLLIDEYFSLNTHIPI